LENTKELFPETFSAVLKPFVKLVRGEREENFQMVPCNMMKEVVI
jgi:hypothetical protein